MKKLLIIGLLFLYNIVQAQKNIIVILSDDYGYELPKYSGGRSYNTPNLDTMAIQSRQFTQCYASPLCSPSRVMLMTGKYGFRNYVAWGDLDTSNKTFANMLHDNGYKTAIYGKWQLSGGDTSIKAFGFDNYVVWNPYGAQDKDKRYKSPHLYQNGAFIDSSLTNNKYGEDIFTDSILNFIDSNKENRFLIYYTMTNTHEPFQPTPDDSTFGSFTASSSTSDTAYMKSMVEYADKKIGLIINKIKSLYLDTNTIILYTGDNGTSARIFSDWNGNIIQGQKGRSNLYGQHVPFIAYGAGVQTGIDSSLIDFTDMLPTLAEIANIPKPTTYGTLDGISFYPQILGNIGNQRTWIYCWFNPLLRGEGTWKAWVRTRHYQLFEISPNISHRTFYNNDTDPLNQNKITSPTPEEKLIKKMLNNVLDSFKALP